MWPVLCKKDSLSAYLQCKLINPIADTGHRVPVIYILPFARLHALQRHINWIQPIQIFGATPAKSALGQTQKNRMQKTKMVKLSKSFLIKQKLEGTPPSGKNSHFYRSRVWSLSLLIFNSLKWLTQPCCLCGSDCRRCNQILFCGLFCWCPTYALMMAFGCWKGLKALQEQLELNRGWGKLSGVVLSSITNSISLLQGNEEPPPYILSIRCHSFWCNIAFKTNFSFCKLFLQPSL